MKTTLEFKWGISKGRDTAGYNICSLYADGKKVSSCNGGGYDMKGEALGDWVTRAFEKELLKVKIPFQYFNGKKSRGYYGLSFHDPNYDPGKYSPKSPPAFYRAASPVPTKRHTIPQIDGACGFSQVEKILQGLKHGLESVHTSRKRQDIYILKEATNEN